MRSFFVAALCLSTIQDAAARLPQSSPRQVAERDAQPEAQSGIFSWLNRIIKRSVKPRQEICYQDEYYNFVTNSTFGETFCNAYMSYPNTTVNVEFTPRVTSTNVYTTIVHTATQLVRTTPVSTVTVVTTVVGSPVPILARDTPSDQVVDDAFNQFRRQAASSNDDDPAMSASFSSACACQTYSGATVTETYTNEPTVVATLQGFAQTRTTVLTTRTAGALTTTVTSTVLASVPTPVGSIPPAGSAPPAGSGAAQSILPIPSSVVAPVGTLRPSGTTNTPAAIAVGEPYPTASPFVCPADNGTIVSQLIGNERFDYLILCDTDLSDQTLYSALSYSTFSQCAAACSKADAAFDEPVCQAAVYDNSPNTNGYNCFLKISANETVAAPGVDTAVLQTIAVGINNTGQDAGPAFTASANSAAPASLSSAVSVALANSSTSLPVVTPGPNLGVGRAAALITSFSTVISGGSTYRTASVYSTYVSANGSWYYSYYSSYSEAWTSATTIVGSGSEATQVIVSNGGSSGGSGAGEGGYVTVTNTTTVTYTYYPTYTVSNQTDTVVYSTFRGDNTFVTASSTIIYTESTEYSNSGGGGGGGSGGEGSGIISSSAVATPTPSISYGSSRFSAQTIISLSGGTQRSTGVLQTQVPTYSSTVVVNTYGTEGGSGFVISGVVPTTDSRGSSTQLSEILVPTESSTVIVNSYATSGGTGFIISGAAPTDTPSLTGTPSTSIGTFSNTDQPRSGPSQGQSTVVTEVPIVSSTVIVNSYGTSGGTGFIISGVAPTNGTTPIVIVPPPTDSPSTGFGTFSNTDQPRSGPSQGQSTDVTEVPTQSSTVIVNSYGTSGGTGFIISGAVPTNGTLIGTTSTLIAPPPTDSPSSGIGTFSNTDQPRSGPSQGQSTNVPTLSSTVIVNSYGTSGGTGFIISGAVSTNGTSLVGTSPTLIAPPPTGSLSTSIGTFSNTDQPRSGPSQSQPGSTDSTDIPTLSSGTVYQPPEISSTTPVGPVNSSASVPSGTAPSGTAPSGTAPSGTAPSNTTPAASSSSSIGTFSNTDQPRSGPSQFESTSIPVISSGNIYQPPETPSSTPGAPVNSTASSPSGTAPLSSPPVPSDSASTSSRTGSDALRTGSQTTAFTTLPGETTSIPVFPFSSFQYQPPPPASSPQGSPSPSSNSSTPVGPTGVSPSSVATSLSITTSNSRTFTFTNSNGNRTPGQFTSGASSTDTAPPGTAPSGTAPSGTAPSGTAPSGTAPSGTGVTPSPSSSPTFTFTNSNGNRTPGTFTSGTSATDTTPSGTAPSGTAPSGTAPSGTAPSGSAPSGSAPSGTAPSGTAPSGSAPSGSAPSGTVPSGSTPISATGVSPSPSSSPTFTFTNSNGDRTPFPFTSSTSPAGTAPSGTAPTGTAPSGSAPSGTGPSGTAPSGTAPTGTAPSGTGETSSSPTFTFTNSNGDRTPFPFTSSTSATGTAPIGTNPSTSLPLTSVPASTCPCPECTAPATTTIYTTITQYGCYSQCLPNQGGYYGGQGPQGNSPQTFGPPVFPQTMRP